MNFDEITDDDEPSPKRQRLESNPSKIIVGHVYFFDQLGESQLVSVKRKFNMEPDDLVKRMVAIEERHTLANVEKIERHKMAMQDLRAVNERELLPLQYKFEAELQKRIDAEMAKYAGSFEVAMRLRTELERLKDVERGRIEAAMAALELGNAAIKAAESSVKAAEVMVETASSPAIIRATRATVKSARDTLEATKATVETARHEHNISTATLEAANANTEWRELCAAARAKKEAALLPLELKFKEEAQRRRLKKTVDNNLELSTRVENVNMWAEFEDEIGMYERRAKMTKSDVRRSYYTTMAKRLNEELKIKVTILYFYMRFH